MKKRKADKNFDKRTFGHKKSKGGYKKPSLISHGKLTLSLGGCAP